MPRSLSLPPNPLPGPESTQSPETDSLEHMGQRSAVYRVKLYVLNPQSGWDDVGTAFVSLERESKNAPLYLIVREESTGKVFLSHKVVLDTHRSTYNKQNETILTWNDLDGDYAVSFESYEALLYIWREIMIAQGRPDNEILIRLAPDFRETETESNVVVESGISEVSDVEALLQKIPEVWKLPQPNEGTLSEIAEIMGKAFATSALEYKKDPEFVAMDKDISTKPNALVEVVESKEIQPVDCITAQVLNDDFMPRLFEMFQVADDLEALQELHSIYMIVIYLLRCNNSTIFNYLLADENFMRTIACLEYDPDATDQGPRHVKFLEQSKLIQVVAFDSPELISKIKDTFRLSYLNDVILNNKVDESTTTSLVHLIYYNHVWIVSALIEDTNFVVNLFSLMVNNGQLDNVDWTSKKLCFQFFGELSQICKTLPLPQRSQHYSALVKLGLLKIFELILHKSSPVSDYWLWVQIGDLLLSLTHMDASFVRNHLLERIVTGKGRLKDSLAVGKVLIPLPVTTLLTPIFNLLSTKDEAVNSSLLQLYSELVVAIYEFDTLIVRHPQLPSRLSVTEKSDLLTICLERFFPQIVDVITRKNPKNLQLEFEAKNFCLEIVYSLFLEHSQHLKPYVQRFRILEAVSTIIERNKKPQVTLAALRIFRLVVFQNDDFYLKRIINLNLLKSVMKLILVSGSRYNLINSSVFEILEIIRANNIKPLLAWLVAEYEIQFKQMTYISLFSQLIEKHEQNIYTEANPTPTHDYNPTFDKEKETAYFEEIGNGDFVVEDIFPSSLHAPPGLPRTDANTLEMIDSLFRTVNRASAPAEENDLVRNIARFNQTQPANGVMPMTGKRKSFTMELPKIRPHKSPTSGNMEVISPKKSKLSE